MATLLKRLLSTYKQNSQPSIVGQIVQILKQYLFFKDIQSNYGAITLIQYLPLLHYELLRHGNRLLTKSDLIIVIEGLIINQQNTNDVYTPGMYIDFQEQNKKFICNGQTIILVIKRQKPLERVLYSNLKDFQKDQNNLYINNKNKIMGLVHHQILQEKIRKIPIFGRLKQFDLIQLISSSSLQILQKQSKTHNVGQNCQYIGYILSGKIKVVYYDIKQEPTSQLIIEKYMKKKFQMMKNSLIISEYKEGDWIGLQQYIMNSSYLSSGQVQTQELHIIWIQFTTFASIINQKINYQIFHRIKNITQAKDIMLTRSLQCKKQKKDKMIEEVRQRENRIKLRQKIDEFKKSSNNKSPIFRSFKRQIYPQQCYFPQSIVHKTKILQSRIALPQLETINFFPQEYQKALIPKLGNQFKIDEVHKALNRKKGNKKALLLKKQIGYHEKQGSPQFIYNRILETLPLKLETRHSTILSTLTPSQSSYFSLKLDSQRLSHLKSSRTHFNKSICNNFRATTKLNESNLSKTLEII